MGEAGETSGLGILWVYGSAEVRPELRPSFRSILVGVGSFLSFSHPSDAPECPGPVLSPMVERDHRLPLATGQVQCNPGLWRGDKLGDAA